VNRRPAADRAVPNRRLPAARLAKKKAADGLAPAKPSSGWDHSSP